MFYFSPCHSIHKLTGVTSAIMYTKLLPLQEYSVASIIKRRFVLINFTCQSRVHLRPLPASVISECVCVCVCARARHYAMSWYVWSKYSNIGFSLECESCVFYAKQHINTFTSRNRTMRKAWKNSRAHQVQLSACRLKKARLRRAAEPLGQGKPSALTPKLTKTRANVNVVKASKPASTNCMSWWSAERTCSPILCTYPHPRSRSWTTLSRPWQKWRKKSNSWDERTPSLKRRYRRGRLELIPCCAA